ncbi:MAG: 1-acyl-sn-glycerol-3-phosphate acyltransferase [Candidatus Wallbacteria bacterium]|nr:1-acyl-sn-glycerol-3-phosphate acyltransferase [Candidatus Wallbacteria bacterium]
MRNAHFELGRFLARLVFTVINVRCTLDGAKNLPEEDQPFVLALNHASMLDGPLVWSVIEPPIYFVTKREFHRVPVLGTVSKRVGNIAIQRGSIDRTAIRGAVEYLTVRKRSIGVFVEGTRTPDGEVHEAKTGSALLVLLTGAPVIPAYIHGTFDIWPRHDRIPGWGPTAGITLGPALRYERSGENPSKQRLTQVAGEITSAIAGLRKSVLAREGKGEGGPTGRFEI